MARFIMTRSRLASLSLSLALAWACQARADMASSGGMSVWAGYTTLNMAGVNQVISDNTAIATSQGYNSTVTKISGGLSAGKFLKNRRRAAPGVSWSASS